MTCAEERNLYEQTLSSIEAILFGENLSRSRDALETRALDLRGAEQELRTAEAALAARDEENHALRAALERIALGISGRTESGLRPNEGGGYGLPRQPKPDWQLAKEALTASRPAQTDNEETRT